MYIVYFIVAPERTKSFYVGMTSKGLSIRMGQHRSAAMRGLKSPLYSCMRKHGIENFLIYGIKQYDTKEECCKSEIEMIAHFRQEGLPLLNLADGGQVGFVLPEERKEEWKAKLSKARQGAKPALGMKHTEENKKFFSECSKRRKLRYPNLDVTKVGFTEANKVCGISKTHYYRLLKRASSNETS